MAATRTARRPVTVGSAVDRFTTREFAPSTVRTYRQTLDQLAGALGTARKLTTLTSEELDATVVRLWGMTSPATWNRHVATIRSFLAFCHRQRWFASPVMLGVERRRERVDHTKAIPFVELDRLWRRPDIGLREKALWRLLYETAARASEVLGLDVDDVDVSNKRAVARSKGGDLEYLHFQSGSARLLPRLMAGRSRGPLFVTELRPPPSRTPATVDLCPDTGRVRLSYRRAEELFKDLSGGWTLHQLRHSAITHLSEANVALPLLMAKSRHASLRSLQRYARPSPDAVSRLTAELDPARRRRIQ